MGQTQAVTSSPLFIGSRNQRHQPSCRNWTLQELGETRFHPALVQWPMGAAPHPALHPLQQQQPLASPRDIFPAVFPHTSINSPSSSRPVTEHASHLVVTGEEPLDVPHTAPFQLVSPQALPRCGGTTGWCKRKPDLQPRGCTTGPRWVSNPTTATRGGTCFWTGVILRNYLSSRCEICLCQRNRIDQPPLTSHEHSKHSTKPDTSCVPTKFLRSSESDV